MLYATPYSLYIAMISNDQVCTCYNWNIYDIRICSMQAEPPIFIITTTVTTKFVVAIVSVLYIVGGHCDWHANASYMRSQKG